MFSHNGHCLSEYAQRQSTELWFGLWKLVFWNLLALDIISCQLHPSSYSGWALSLLYLEQIAAWSLASPCTDSGHLAWGALPDGLFSILLVSFSLSKLSSELCWLRLWCLLYEFQVEFYQVLQLSFFRNFRAFRISVSLCASVETSSVFSAGGMSGLSGGGGRLRSSRKC